MGEQQTFEYPDEDDMRSIHMPRRQDHPLVVVDDVAYSFGTFMEQFVNGTLPKNVIREVVHLYADGRSRARAFPKKTRDALLAIPESVLFFASSKRIAERQWIKNRYFREWLSSREAAHWFWEKGRPTGEPDDTIKLNGGLYTHNADNTLNRVRSTDILKLFTPGHEEDWPQLILTSNHSDTRGTFEITETMRLMGGLLRRLLPVGAYDLERDPKGAECAKGKTIMVTALNAEETGGRNAARILYRMLHLRENPTLAKRMEIQKKDGETPFEEELKCRAPSPAAIHLAKLMLKLMCEEPERIDIKSRELLRETCNPEESEPIVLRADAEKIAAHITLMGYSKAANTVHDALRYLAYELTSRNKVGEPIYARRIVAKNGQSSRIDWIHDAEDVAPIVRQCALIGFNGPGAPITDEERDLGIHLLRLRNEFDQVIGHIDMANGSLCTVDAYDVVHTIRGTRRGLGHLAGDSLGKPAVAFKPAESGKPEVPAKPAVLGYFECDRMARWLLWERLAPKFCRTPEHVQGGWVAHVMSNEFVRSSYPHYFGGGRTAAA